VAKNELQSSFLDPTSQHDGGSIISARIDQDSGSNLKMNNDGKIIPPANEYFTVPVGANMEITNGTIQY
jgi:hypothetical protein